MMSHISAAPFLGAPRKLDYLGLVWPEAAKALDRGEPLPPLDDDEVKAYPGGLPLWVLDKYEVLRRIYPGPRMVGTHNDATPDLPGATWVVKPRHNLDGMAKDVVVVEGDHRVPDGFLWQRKYSGRHISVDYAVARNNVLGLAIAEGVSLPAPRFGQFAAWTVYGQASVMTSRTRRNPAGTYGRAGRMVLARLFPGQLYTGLLNVEMIDTGDKRVVLEVHFRPSLSFGPLYGHALRAGFLRVAGGYQTAEQLPPPVGGVAIPVLRSDWPVYPLEVPDPQPSWRRAMQYHWPPP